MTQTYFDLVEHLIISSYGGPQDAEQRDIRTAVHPTETPFRPSGTIVL